MSPIEVPIGFVVDKWCLIVQNQVIGSSLAKSVLIEGLVRRC